MEKKEYLVNAYDQKMHFVSIYKGASFDGKNKKQILNENDFYSKKLSYYIRFKSFFTDFFIRKFNRKKNLQSW